MATTTGTKQHPWTLKTPPGTSEFQAYQDPAANPPALVVQVGKTELRYDLRCLHDLHTMLKEPGGLDAAGERGRTEACGGRDCRSLGSFCGQSCWWLVRAKEGMRGRFAMYVPPVLKELSLTEVEENPRNNRMRAK